MSHSLIYQHSLSCHTCPWQPLCHSYIKLEPYISSYLKIISPQPCFSFNKYLSSSCDKPDSPSLPLHEEPSGTHDLYQKSKLQPQGLCPICRLALFSLDRVFKNLSQHFKMCKFHIKKPLDCLFLLKNQSHWQHGAHISTWKYLTRAEVGHGHFHSPYARVCTHSLTCMCSFQGLTPWRWKSKVGVWIAPCSM